MSRTKLKQRVQEKLQTIQDQRDEIVQFLDGVLGEATAAASSLSAVTDKSKFQNKYRSTMQTLEEHLNTLFLIKASLPGEDGSTDGSESEADENEPPDDDSDNNKQYGARDNSALSPTPDRDSPGPSSSQGTQPSAKYSKGSYGRKHGDQINPKEEQEEEIVINSAAVYNEPDENDQQTEEVASGERQEIPHQDFQSTPKQTIADSSVAQAQYSKQESARPEAAIERDAAFTDYSYQMDQARHSKSAALKKEYEVPEEAVKQRAAFTDYSFQTDPAFLATVSLPEQQFVPHEPAVPEVSQDLKTVTEEPYTKQGEQKSMVSSREDKSEDEPVPHGFHNQDKPRVMPPPFGSRVFKRKKREISGKEASINMIMNSLNIRRDTMEAVNQVQEVLSAGKGSVAASDVSQASATSNLGHGSQKMSQSCLSLKSVGNVSVTSSSFNPNYGFGPEIPSLTFQDGDEVNVVLLEVITPSMFWVRPEGAELDTLLEAMSVHYIKLLHKSGLGCEPKVGMVCAARFTQDDMWYRAKIIGVTPDQNVSINECHSEFDQSFGPHISQVDRFAVEVMYIDYGNQEKLSEKRLWQLAPEYCCMPIQAFCCALARVLPMDEQKWMMASHMLYAYNTTTLTGILSTEPNCPVLLLDLKLPGADTTFSEYLISNNVARLVTNADIAKTFLGASNGAGDTGPSVYLETVKAMSPKMNNSESSLQHALGQGDSVPSVDFSESDNKKQTQSTHLNNLEEGTQPHSKPQSSDSNNERSNTPSTDEWKNTKADGSLDNLLDEALAAEDDRDANKEMKLSPVSEKLGGLSKDSLLNSVCDVKDEAPDGWLTISLGAPTTELKAREITVPRNGFIRFMMSHINDPGDFYVHLVDQRTSEILDQLNKDLNAEYKGYMKSMMGRYFAEEFSPSVNDICCACFSKDKTFYRALVMEVRKPEKGIRRTGTKMRLRQPKEQEEKCEVRVFYLDFGNIEWVAGSKVYPLSRHFWDIPVQAVHCSLANVRPTGITGRWCKNATDLFESRTGFDKSFLGYVYEDSEVISEPIPVAILDLTDDTWINPLLVEKTFAIAVHADAQEDGTGSKFEDAEMADEIEQMKSWDPMAEDFLSERNSMMVDVDDASVALTGYKSEPDKRPCKFFGKTKSGCWRGNDCPFAHVDPGHEGDLARDKGEAFCLIDTDVIRVPNEDSWVPVAVSAIFNPGRFYINFPCGTKSYLSGERDDEGYEGSSVLPSNHRETLEMMTAALNEHYCKITRRDRQLLGLAPGEMVAAQYSADSTWHRAKVVDADTDNLMVEVFYVDFGNSEWISEDKVRLMEPQFLHMPFQAIECFLSNVEPADGLAWSRGSRGYFHKIVDGRRLFAHIVSKNLNGVLQIELYDTESDEIFINNSLIQMGYARSVEPKETDSTSSVDSGRPRSRMSSRSSIVGKKKRYSGVDPDEIYMPG